MPKKYHISTKVTPLNLDYVYKFRIVRGENCINCGKCTKVCIYEAHKRRTDDPRRMADPNTIVCRNCFRCIQECPRGALEKSLDKDFTKFGGTYWKADNLLSLWKQAEDGAVPVSGAGYRGPFTGTGFDSMWTDMSEIVRPTRDGIHGREYINTAVDLGRKLNHLTFDASGQLAVKVPDTVTVPLPIIFDLKTNNIEPHVKEALLNAAAELNTMVIMPAAEITADYDKYINNIIPWVTADQISIFAALLKKARIITVDYGDIQTEGFTKLTEKIKNITPAMVIIRVPAVNNIEEIVTNLVRDEAAVIHIAADWCGRETDNPANGRHIKDIIRSVHMKLVEEGIRDETTLIVSGGIGMAEHVPKSMLCGADLTAIDMPLMVALGVRVYENPEKLLLWPDGLEKIPVAVLKQRIVNLIGAWHSQILEMMGAMGIREARRLRGESGRAMFFEDMDRDTFRKIFKKEKK